MSKIDLVPVTGAQNLSAINDNFQKIEDALNEKVLYRDNPPAEPNQVESDVDMNGKRLYNLPEPKSDGEPVRRKEFGDVKKSIRVADKELPTLPPASVRRNKLLSFDAAGNPVVSYPSNDSATQLRLDLTSYPNTLTPEVKWDDIPAHADPAFDVQVQALANRVAFMKEQYKKAPLRFKDFDSALAAASGLESGQLIDTLLDETRYEVQGENLIEKGLTNDRAKPLQSYAVLRTYTGKQTLVDITQRGIFGRFYYDDTDTTSADNGATIIVGTDGRRWKRLGAGATLRAAWFEMDNTGVTDNATKLASLKNAALALSDAGYGPRVIFEAGDYSSSLFPNWWDVHGLVIDFEGRVFWTNTGTSPTLRFETDQNPLHRWGIKVGTSGGKLILRGGPTTGQAAVIKNVYASDIRFMVHGCGTDKIAVSVQGCVVSEFDMQISPHDSDLNQWYMDARPLAGLYIGAISGDYTTGTSYCNFSNLVVGGVSSYGLYAENCMGNTFNHGGLEWNQKGVILVPTAFYNKFYGMNFEEHSVVDIEDAGTGTEFYGIDSQNAAYAGKNTVVFGGNNDKIDVLESSENVTLHGVKYAKGLGLNGLTISSPTAVARDCVDLRTGRYYGVARSLVTPTASPYDYVNNTNKPARVNIQGGTVTQLVLYSGTDTAIIPASTGQVILMPSEALSIQYSAAPTLKVFSM